MVEGAYKVIVDPNGETRVEQRWLDLISSQFDLKLRGISALSLPRIYYRRRLRNVPILRLRPRRESAL